MLHSLKVMLLSLTVILAMSCCLFTLPSPQALDTPTVEVKLETSVPSQSPVPVLPSDTPAPLAPTNTPVTTSLNAAGPHILFKGQAGVWISNPDGSFPTRVTDVQLQGDLRNALSPSGDRMAVVVQNDQGLDLVIIKIPGGETQTIAHLLSITSSEGYSNPTSAKGMAYLAIRYYDSLAWQPGDGKLLAFTGAINGPTADLYLYDTQTKEITQLTSGPSQAVLPRWSPDGQYILNYGVSWVPPFGGAIGPANRLDGVWSVRAADGKINTLPKTKGDRPIFVAWQDDSHFIAYDYDETCGAQNLRSVDIASGESTPIMDFSFYSFIARSPENGALLFSGAPGCANSVGEGTFILPAGETTPTRVLDERSWEIEWLPESKAFFAYPAALISSDGSVRYDAPVPDSSFKPALSMQGTQAWEVIQNRVGTVRIKTSGGDWQNIMNGFVSQLIWDPINGKTLLIVMDDGALYAASSPDFTPRQMGSVGDSVDLAIWLP